MRLFRRCLASLLVLTALAMLSPSIARAVCPDLPEPVTMAMGGDEGAGGTGLSGEGLGGTGLGGEGDEGVGGTGLGNDEGVGGTGHAPDEGLGGTGVYGTITGFGSICVNGLEIEYGPSTPVEVDGGRSSTKSLHVGDVVWVEARPEGRSLRARRIAIQSVLVGPVGRMTKDARQMHVLGRRVTLAPDASVSDRATGRTLTLAEVRGATVAVRGLVDHEGIVRSSRVERVPDSTPARAFGRLTREGGTARVGGVAVSLPEARDAAGPLVLVEGRWANGEARLHAEKVEPGWSGASRAREISIEGFVIEKGANSFDLSYGEVMGSGLADGLPDVKPGDRVVVRVRPLADGRFEALDLRHRHGEARNDSNHSGADDDGDDDRSGSSGGEDDGDSSGHSGDGDDRSGPGGGDRADRPERADRAERPERPERAERAERPERVERAERPERPERADP
ncbi:MAG: hypothetical protein JRH10_13740 [Deltaproteobacteria bacterium]|nr:hypothetical protein [Deltaproteobacteria bacterium]